MKTAIHPLVQRYEAHPAAASLFGWQAPQDADEDEIIQGALDWLMDHINEDIEAPKDVAEFFEDAHQPCHAGSLYYAGVFPEGDRGGNSIPTKQSKNLHALWDGLLGPKLNAGDVQRRAKSIMALDKVVEMAVEITDEPLGLNPGKWVLDSADMARTFVYTPEIMSAVEAAGRGSKAVETIDLSEEYLTKAGKLASYQACFAAHRLAKIWRQDLGELAK